MLAMVFRWLTPDVFRPMLERATREEGQTAVTKPTSEPEVTQDRKGLIVEVAAELFASKGIASTTVRAIGDAAGILSGSLYHYFPSKDAIVDEIMTSFLDDVNAQYSAVLGEEWTTIEQFRGLVYASLECTRTHAHAAEIYQNDANYIQHSPQFEYVQQGAVRIRGAWMSVLEAGVANGTFRSDVPTWLMYHLLRDSIWLTVRWFKSSAKYDHAALAQDCFKLFLQGFVSPGIDVGELDDPGHGRPGALART
jgi:AcrR family transcriptional regulator